MPAGFVRKMRGKCETVALELDSLKNKGNKHNVSILINLRKIRYDCAPVFAPGCKMRTGARKRKQSVAVYCSNRPNLAQY